MIRNTRKNELRRESSCRTNASRQVNCVSSAVRNGVRSRSPVRGLGNLLVMNERHLGPASWKVGDRAPDLQPSTVNANDVSL
jgi:hypothetical protein